MKALCACGCSHPVGPDSRGRPRRFVHGHNRRAPITQKERRKAAGLTTRGTVRKAAGEKAHARNVVQHAVRMGTLTRPEACSACHAKGKVEGHHADYSLPLQVEWLCPGCHFDADFRDGHPRGIPERGVSSCA